MRETEAGSTSRLMRKVIQSLTIYNDLARNGESAKYSPGELRQRIADDRDSVIVAVRGDKIVGFCVNRKDDGTLLIEWYGVHADCRGQGVGRRLVERIVASAPRRGCHKVWCDCNTQSTASKTLLRAMGFHAAATLLNHWYGHDFTLWERPVAKTGSHAPVHAGTHVTAGHFANRFATGSSSRPGLLAARPQSATRRWR